MKMEYAQVINGLFADQMTYSKHDCNKSLYYRYHTYEYGNDHSYQDLLL